MSPAVKLPGLVVTPSRSLWSDGQRPAVLQEWRDAHQRLAAWGGAWAGRWMMEWPGLGVYLFGPAGDVEAIPEPHNDLAAIEDVFTRGVLPVVLLGRGSEALHASAVERDGNVVAFMADSGTGKSSLAFSVAARGFRHWADDRVMLSADGPDPSAIYSLPFPVRVEPPVFAAVGVPARHVPRVRPLETARLTRVYVLKRDPSLPPGAADVRLVSGSETFKTFFAHSQPFDLHGPEASWRSRQAIACILRLSSAVPIHELRFGPGIEALPALAETVERHIGGS